MVTPYRTTHERLRGLLLRPLLDGDIETDAAVYHYCDWRVVRLLETCELLGIDDYDEIKSEDDFVDMERGLELLESAEFNGLSGLA